MTFLGTLLTQVDKRDLEQWVTRIMKFECANLEKDALISLILGVVPEREILAYMTVGFLRDTCRKFQISGHSKLSKSELIELLRENERVLRGETSVVPQPRLTLETSVIPQPKRLTIENSNMDALTLRICSIAHVTPAEARRLKEFLCERVYPRLGVADADSSSVRQKFLGSSAQIEHELKFSKDFVLQLRRFFETLFEV